MTNCVCSVCKRTIRKNQNSICCNINMLWVHAKCDNLSLDQFQQLCNEEDGVPWCCSMCISNSLPFHDCSDCDFETLFNTKTTNQSTIHLNLSNLNNLPYGFSNNRYNDSSQSVESSNDTLPSDTTYYLPENALLLLGDIKANSSFFAMHINIRSLTTNFSKLQTLISSLKIKPQIISINETWLKGDQNGDYNSLFDDVLVTNCRKGNKGGGVALYIQSSLSFCIREELTLMKETIFESLFALYQRCVVRTAESSITEARASNHYCSD